MKTSKMHDKAVPLEQQVSISYVMILCSLKISYLSLDDPSKKTSFRSYTQSLKRGHGKGQVNFFS